MTEYLTAGAVSIGVFYMLVAATGMIRLPDFYHRIHAPTKAATLGLMFLLASTALALQQKGVGTKALLAVLFFVVTAPVGAHLLCRAAYRCGIAPNRETTRDDYRRVADRRAEQNAVTGEHNEAMPTTKSGGTE